MGEDVRGGGAGVDADETGDEVERRLSDSLRRGWRKLWLWLTCSRWLCKKHILFQNKIPKASPSRKQPVFRK